MRGVADLSKVGRTFVTLQGACLDNLMEIVRLHSGGIASDGDKTVNV